MANNLWKNCFLDTKMPKGRNVCAVDYLESTMVYACCIYKIMAPLL